MGDVMAEHPDVALVRRGYAAFSAADTARLSELLAEDARQYQLALDIPSCLAGAGRSVGGALLRRLVDLLRGEENDRLAIDRSGRGDRQVH